MSPRVVIAGLTGLVIGLLGLTVFQARLLVESRDELRAATLPVRERPTNSAARPTRLKLQQLPPIHIHTAATPFNWSSIESDDYATYVANLRALGCPEATLRDIIVADVNQVFEARRKGFAEPPGDWDFWRHPDENPEAANPSDAARDREADLGELERERLELLTDLLGEGFRRAELERFTTDETHHRSLQFLEPTKRDAVARARARYHQAMDGLVMIPDPAAQQAASAAATRDMEDALGQALTMSEREQLEMRSSALADGIRDGLRGFGASKEEFEKIFRLEKAFAEERQAFELARSGGTEKQAPEKTEAAGIELETKVRAALGEQRYSEYQRSRDPEYQTLYSLAREHQVSPTVATEVFGMRQTVKEHTDRIRQNPFLTADQKIRALEAVRSETESAVVDVLGEPMLREYQRVGGGWLIELTQPIELGETGREIVPPPLPPGVPPAP